MCANCHVFDKLQLSDNYNKCYLEWITPQIDDSLEEYALKMIEKIDASSPFVLVGYSFGGIIVQEMNKFIKPQKTIIIASIKNDSEKPSLFEFGKRIKFAQRFPLWSLVDNERMKRLLARFIYKAKDFNMLEYVSYTEPTYMQWSVYQILNWSPTTECPNLYHVHGTRDQTFPYKNILNVRSIEGGDHFMVFKKPKKVSTVLNEIIMNRQG